MPSLNIGQMGHKRGSTAFGELKSKPKLTKINADDFMSLIYRNMGNNHAYPMVWMQQLTHSGTETVIVASGTKFHGMEAADYVNAVITPLADPGGYYWVENDTTAGTISIMSETSNDNVDYNVMFMLGEAPEFGGIGDVATVSGIKNKPMLSANVYFTGQSLP